MLYSYAELLDRIDAVEEELADSMFEDQDDCLYDEIDALHLLRDVYYLIEEGVLEDREGRLMSP